MGSALDCLSDSRSGCAWGSGFGVQDRGRDLGSKIDKGPRLGHRPIIRSQFVPDKPRPEMRDSPPHSTIFDTEDIMIEAF